MATDNLTHLAAFAAVARHRSFRKAGAELALSTSAVSYAIRALEERLGACSTAPPAAWPSPKPVSACWSACNPRLGRCTTHWKK